MMNNSRHAIRTFTHARLPQWLLPGDWPTVDRGPALATIDVSEGVIHHLRTTTDGDAGMNLEGRLVLPGLAEAHAHLDKTFTRHRIGPREPGLLSAIHAMHADQQHWSYADLYERAERALEQAYQNGVVLVRSHVDWISYQTPLAWQVLGDLAVEWQSRLQLQRVALIPLGLMADQVWTRKVAQLIRFSDNGVMGGFIHSHNFDASAIEHLVVAANHEGLDLDLHIDEELVKVPAGLPALLEVLDKFMGEGRTFKGRIVCSHVCALSSTGETDALRLLDRVAQQPVTFVALPATNLLLQDARTGHTPRQRGLTLVHEAVQRKIPLLIGTDNVQDAFCAWGQYDPVKALQLGIYSAHLDQAFDFWSQSICRSDWLSRPLEAQSLEPSLNKQHFSLLGKPADLVIFDTDDPLSWPSDSARLVMRQGEFLHGPSTPFAAILGEDNGAKQ